MQPAGSAPLQNAETELPDAAGLIRHLTHELRQPLSGIESAAYYLDMVVSEARPDLIPHCRRLRAMVQHASWLLDDAELCAMAQPPARTAHSLAAVLQDVSRRMLAEDEAVLDLHLESEAWVLAPETLPRLVWHVVAFFRDVAGCHDPIHAGVEGGQGWIAARILAEGCEDARGAARMLKAASERGFLGRFLAAAGGAFEVQAEDSAERLALSIRLPAAEQGS